MPDEDEHLRLEQNVATLIQVDYEGIEKIDLIE
jgi:hypothetical protein